MASSAIQSNHTQQNPTSTNVRDSVVVSDVLTPGAQIAATAVLQSHENAHTETPSTDDVDSSRCFIMELPKELRLIIYEFVFHDILSGIATLYPPRTPRKRHLDQEEAPDLLPPKAARKDRAKRVLALIHACHAFHAESIGIGTKLVAALKSSINDEVEAHEKWLKQPGVAGGCVHMGTTDFRRQLRELRSMKKLLCNRCREKMTAPEWT